MDDAWRIAWVLRAATGTASDTQVPTGCLAAVGCMGVRTLAMGVPSNLSGGREEGGQSPARDTPKGSTLFNSLR